MLNYIFPFWHILCFQYIRRTCLTIDASSKSCSAATTRRKKDRSCIINKVHLHFQYFSSSSTSLSSPTTITHTFSPLLYFRASFTFFSMMMYFLFSRQLNGFSDEFELTGNNNVQDFNRINVVKAWILFYAKLRKYSF